MRRRISLGIIVGLLCAVAALRPPLSSTVAQPAPNDGLEVVRAAYNLALDKYYRPLDPADLLSGAWSGLSTVLQGENQPALPALATLPNDRDGAFSAFAKSYTTLLATLPASIKPVNVGFVATSEMLDSLNDTHTGFIPPDTSQADAASDASGQPTGLGIRHTDQEPWIVTEVAAHGPADQAGVEPGDVIVAINGNDVTGSGPGAFARAIDGSGGGSVRLAIDRGGQQQNIAVARGAYYFPPLATRMLSGGVAYLRLTSFAQVLAPQRDGRKILDALDSDLDQFDVQGATGLVVDLRDNGGGFAASEWLGRFLPENALSIVDYDARGHQATTIVSGHMHATQLPMVVLVNGSSYSAAEVFAATAHETGRALLVGAQTGGSLRSAQLFTLPDSASMQLAVADVMTAYDHYTPEGQGYPVDNAVPDTRTAADYAAGHDPQLDAAVAALPQAPAPPAYDTTYTGMTRDQLASMFSRYSPNAGQIPLTSRLTSVQRLGSFDANHVNEAVSGTRDPIALQQVYRGRGWLGVHSQDYWSALLATPSVEVAAELYATPEGAEQGLTTNDAPDSQELSPSPVQLGDDAVAFRGLWTAAGSVGLSWRRGNVVFTVAYDDAPGFENMDEAVAVARLVDQAYSRQPPAACRPGRHTAGRGHRPYGDADWRA